MKPASYRDGADGEGEYVGEAGDGDRHPGVLQGLTHHLMQGQSCIYGWPFCKWNNFGLKGQ